ncbi:hypothetical protein Ndes2526B_g05476 [Nannochloris sp. 'desiccata']
MVDSIPVAEHPPFESFSNFQDFLVSLCKRQTQRTLAGILVELKDDYDPLVAGGNLKAQCGCCCRKCLPSLEKWNFFKPANGRCYTTRQLKSIQYQHRTAPVF